MGNSHPKLFLFHNNLPTEVTAFGGLFLCWESRYIHKSRRKVSEERWIIQCWRKRCLYERGSERGWYCLRKQHDEISIEGWLGRMMEKSLVGGIMRESCNGGHACRNHVAMVREWKWRERRPPIARFLWPLQPCVMCSKIGPAFYSKRGLRPNQKFAQLEAP